MSEGLQPAFASNATTKRIVIAAIVVECDDADDENVAADLADNLREYGWKPIGITVNRV